MGQRYLFHFVLVSNGKMRGVTGHVPDLPFGSFLYACGKLFRMIGLQHLDSVRQGYPLTL